MEADFSGWATKAGLKCSDGRTIMPNAFEHQDKITVPLVWQHGHRDPENVLGHAILENRPEGVWCDAFFNDSSKAKHAKLLVQHGDIRMMSIWANDLIERSKRVFHGAIREVSLVLSGANPGALIDPVSIRHSDGDEETLEDEAIIYTGLSFEHTNLGGGMTTGTDDKKKVAEVYDSMTDEQKEFLHSLVGGAQTDEEETVEHAAGGKDDLQGIYDSLNADQKDLLHFLVGEAMQSSDSLQQDALGEDQNDDNNEEKEVKHNVFEDADKGEGTSTTVLSHSDMEGIIADAQRNGSLKHAFEQYALAHGITDIDTLFPDAVAINSTPEFIQRRTEWVSTFMGATTKRPFSRIKTFSADITEEEARAKGYIKGNLKKEEFFTIAKRETTPTTIYKKQKLDRDDVVDITDFDVIAWLKSEMRLMLDEELARAGLIGDGRDIASDDKISETNIRPIASDHELFVTTVNMNLGDANSSIQELIDAVIRNRKYYKGTGTPTLFTTESIIASFLLLKDTLGRSLYKTTDEVAAVLRVSAIVPVEVMEEDTTLVAIMVNPVDYTWGATRGGEVNMFDDFDIDYNQQKYLIETRVAGCLTKLKSAIVFRQTASGDVLVVPTAPTFDPETGELTIIDTTHVVYKRTDTNATVTNGGSPYTIASGDSITIQATPDSGYYFETSEVDDWTFTAD